MVHIEQITQGTTAASYAGRMYPWKAFCEKHLAEYGNDLKYPYTVRSVDMVTDFFKKIVFKRRALRRTSLKRDVKVPIDVRDEASSSSNPPRTLHQILGQAPKNKQGNYTIEAPLSKSVVEQYKKALLRLYQYQARARPQATTWSNPAASTLVTEQLKAHYLSLIYETVHTRLNLTASPLYRDAYSPREFTKVLGQLWKDNSMQELFSITLRHSFVLRDQDLRGLSFGDCIPLVTTFANNPSSQQPLCFVLCIDKGKTL
ncbi:unnamed protein product [Mucor fragilis]